jgi:hypothetical protein
MSLRCPTAALGTLCTSAAGRAQLKRTPLESSALTIRSAPRTSFNHSRRWDTPRYRFPGTSANFFGLGGCTSFLHELRRAPALFHLLHPSSAHQARRGDAQSIEEERSPSQASQDVARSWQRDARGWGAGAGGRRGHGRRSGRAIVLGEEWAWNW